MLWIKIISLFLIFSGVVYFIARLKKEKNLTQLLNNDIEKNKIQQIIQKSNTQEEAIQKIRFDYKLNTVQSVEIIKSLQDKLS